MKKELSLNECYKSFVTEKPIEGQYILCQVDIPIKGRYMVCYYDPDNEIQKNIVFWMPLPTVGESYIKETYVEVSEGVNFNKKLFKNYISSRSEHFVNYNTLLHYRKLNSLYREFCVKKFLWKIGLYRERQIVLRYPQDWYCESIWFLLGWTKIFIK